MAPVVVGNFACCVTCSWALLRLAMVSARVSLLASTLAGESTVFAWTGASLPTFFLSLSEPPIIRTTPRITTAAMIPPTPGSSPLLCKGLLDEAAACGKGRCGVPRCCAWAAIGLPQLAQKVPPGAFAVPQLRQALPWSTFVPQ